MKSAILTWISKPHSRHNANNPSHSYIDWQRKQQDRSILGISQNINKRISAISRQTKTQASFSLCTWPGNCRRSGIQGYLVSEVAAAAAAAIDRCFPNLMANCYVLSLYSCYTRVRPYRRKRRCYICLFACKSCYCSVKVFNCHFRDDGCSTLLLLSRDRDVNVLWNLLIALTFSLQLL